MLLLPCNRCTVAPLHWVHSQRACGNLRCCSQLPGAASPSSLASHPPSCVQRACAQAGKPTCVDDYNPCAATTCPFGNTCTYEASGSAFQLGSCCHSRSLHDRALTSTSSDPACRTRSAALPLGCTPAAACQALASTSPSSLTLPLWRALQAGDQQGTCISVCASVRCKKGKVCIVTPVSWGGILAR